MVANDGYQPTAYSAELQRRNQSLVAAGYGATLLPHEASTPLRLTQLRAAAAAVAVAAAGDRHRAGEVERPTQHVLDVLWGLSAG